jgi:hypothetical protein
MLHFQARSSKKTLKSNRADFNSLQFQPGPTATAAASIKL